MSAATTSFLLSTRGEAGWDRFVSRLTSQTIPADQIVVVIDRATDEAQRQAFRSCYPKIDFLFNSANIGLTRSLNRGLEVATGEYIFRTDDDDDPAPERIEHQLRAFAETGADIVCSWAEGVLSRRPDRPWLIKCPTTHDDIRCALLRRNVLVHSTVAFRRSAVVNIGGYDESLLYAQDYGLYLRALREGLSFAAVPEPLVRRLYSDNSITVRLRHRQMMYSALARLEHSARTGNPSDFMLTMARYALRMATPNSLRAARRWASGIWGTGG